MIVVLKPGATEEDIKQIVRRLEERGYRAHVSKGVERTVIGAIGVLDEEKALLAEQLQALECVERVVPILEPYKLVSRKANEKGTVIRLGGAEIGGREVVVMAGPCAVESREQLLSVAEAVKRAGAKVLRGGAFKPRTSPYSFEGLGKEGLEILAEARRALGLPVVTEVRDLRDVELVAEYADILQIGARNMQNFDLLREVGRVGKPVLLKRGFAATIKEWLMAAEHIASKGGNLKIILCERGIRTFETSTRFTLDLNAIPLLKRLTHLPVIVDPSHGTGKSELVPAMAKAAVAAGADGLLIEVHPQPERALSDGPQSLRPEEFERMMRELKPVAEAVGRTL